MVFLMTNDSYTKLKFFDHWPDSFLTPILADDEVHVWAVETLSHVHKLSQLRCYLADDEIERANRFHFDTHRHRFVILRGILRCLLADYSGQAPADLRFWYNEQGKPYLQPKSQSIMFNLSHSGEIALYAFSYQREIGVDIERSSGRVSYLQIAKRFFSASEQEILRSLPDHEKQAAFFACWSRKEAYIKAKGLGLSLPLDSFDVSLRPNEPAKLLASCNYPTDVKRWRMSNLDVADGYAAAVVVAGQDWRIKSWRYVV